MNKTKHSRIEKVQSNVLHSVIIKKAVSYKDSPLKKQTLYSSKRLEKMVFQTEMHFLSMNTIYLRT